MIRLGPSRKSHVTALTLVMLVWLIIVMAWAEGPSVTPSWLDRWTLRGVNYLKENTDPSASSREPAQYGGDSQPESAWTETHVDAKMPPSYNHAPADYVPIGRPTSNYGDALSHGPPQNRPHGGRPDVEGLPVAPSHDVAHEEHVVSTAHSVETSQASVADSHQEGRPGPEDNSASHGTAQHTTYESQTVSEQHAAPHLDEGVSQDRLPAGYDPQAYNGSERINMTTFNFSSLPNPVPQRSPVHLRYLTMITMVRNQRRWLREWLEFYLVMGIEHFIIYDNNSEDDPLDILQCYIDQNIVTYIPWPPKSIPGPWRPFKTELEARQYHWFHDALDTCLDNTWTIHRQAPCQLAAFADALIRSKGGVTRWLISTDVDEYMFPRPGSGYDSIANLLRSEYSNVDHLTVYGNVFGTSGYVEHAARRRPGEPLQALMTENYIYRAELQHNDPWAGLGVGNWEVHGKGLIGGLKIGGGDHYSRKSFADPDLVGDYWIHAATPPKNKANWSQVIIWVGDRTWKFNHYAYLSQADARQKSESNRNPYMNYSEQVNEFFSRVKDTEIHYYIPELKMRMMNSIQKCSSRHPDDWDPPGQSSLV